MSSALWVDVSIEKFRHLYKVASVAYIILVPIFWVLQFDYIYSENYV